MIKRLSREERIQADADTEMVLAQNSGLHHNLDGMTSIEVTDDMIAHLAFYMKQFLPYDFEWECDEQDNLIRTALSIYRVYLARQKNPGSGYVTHETN